MGPARPTQDDIRRKAAEFDTCGDHEIAAILRAVADEMEGAEESGMEGLPRLGGYGEPVPPAA